MQNLYLRRFLSALVAGAILGAALVWAVRALLPAREDAVAAPAQGPEPIALPEGSPAAAYVRAVQQGDWDAVIDQVAWMQNRMRKAAASDAEVGETPAEVRDDLRRRLGQRRIEDRQLLPEGVEDRHVFAPDADVRPVSEDAGELELERPVAKRVWFFVGYPTRASALRDPDQLPIRALRVGLNLDRAGEVLKANVIGNLEIDWDSLSYDWPE